MIFVSKCMIYFKLFSNNICMQMFFFKEYVVVCAFI
jgi:hypothetical protein